MHNNAIKNLLNAAIIYLILGVGAGVFYREFTRFNDFPEGGYTQLSVVHTHVLTLGFIVLLLALVLEKVFGYSRSPKLFTWFFWLYNTGLAVTAAMLLTHGCLTVLGKESGPAIAGIAGLGHIMLTAGMVVFVAALRRSVLAAPATTQQDAA